MSNSSLPLADVLGHEVTDKRIDILRRIGEVGSISEAARGAGVSYKAAWQALETLTNLAGVPLVEKVVGGTGGGGAALTPAGQRVLQAAHALAAARRQVLSRLHSDDDAATGRAALALRTSMRNQFPCTVGKVRAVGGQVRVQLLLAELRQDYSERGVELKEVASGWRFQARQEYAEELSRLWSERAPRYSRAVLETLTLIAYRQPITRAEIEAIRGVAVSSQIINTLKERGWV